MALGSKPVSGPVQGAEERACADRRVGASERATPDAIGDEGADAALVAIALGHDARTEGRRQRVHRQVRRRPLDLVEQAEHVRSGHLVQAVGERGVGTPGRGERFEQPIERAVLAEEQDLVLAAEVVVQVARRQVGGDSDVAHAGGGKPAGAEDARGGAHDRDAARISTK